jgi:hypothetical protein
MKSNSQFDLMWRLIGGMPLEREYKFHPTRKWRFDYFHSSGVAIELEGGIYTGGRHTRGSGFLKDMEKYNDAASRGILVFRVPSHQIGAEWLRPIVATIKKGGSSAYRNLLEQITKGGNNK